MPITDLTRLAEIVLRLILFGAFGYFFITSINSFTSLLIEIVGYINGGATGGAGSISGLNLGCVAEKIGLVTFLNTMFIMLLAYTFHL